MKKIIKDNPKKTVVGSITTIAVLVLLLLNIFEKAEPIVARLLESKPASVENYSIDAHVPNSEYETKEASKK